MPLIPIAKFLFSSLQLTELDLPGFPPHQLQLKNSRTNNTVTKYQPTKALQWHAVCRKKINGKRNRGNNLDRAF